MLADALERYRPDLLVVDTGDFPACCRDALRRFPRDRVVVVGPEPSSDYYRSAIDLGAGAWISRDSLADRLSTTIRALSQRAP
ncbi:response regulator transcription factor [Kineosporia sp. R_H_3]|uniref:response regulator transcription factor n=1 Tax=Kineosporia sp. R_H_3 TaxID=1961848 RepID=UPI00117AD1AC|nr:response regulator transcription factor [Kineosporia sp. R_H_3]